MDPRTFLAAVARDRHTGGGWRTLAACVALIAQNSRKDLPNAERY